MKNKIIILTAGIILISAACCRADQYVTVTQAQEEAMYESEYQKKDIQYAVERMRSVSDWHNSGKSDDYKRGYDDATKERFYPYIIEPSGGVDRSVLAFMVDAYHEEKVKEEIRVVMKFSKELAPVKVAVFPLLRNRPEIVELARKISAELKKKFVTVYDDTGSIGKLYRRQDEVGTLYCITVDVHSLEDRQVTVRDRDSMLQERVSIDNLKQYLSEKLDN